MAKQAHVYDKTYGSTKQLKEHKSENRYRNFNEIQSLEDEIKELEAGESGGGDPDNMVDNGMQKPDPTNEDTTWQKRYSDLRSHMSKKENEWKNTVQTLQTRLEQVEAAKSAPKFPKTEEEVAEWMQKYPDVAAMVKTIAGKTTEEMNEGIKRDLAVLRAKTQENMFKESYLKLLDKHPDFDQLRETADFKEWISDQPDNLQNAIFNPVLDDQFTGVKAAARVIDLYKADKGLLKAKKTPESQREDNNQAAKSVNTKSNRSSINTGQGKEYSESMVANMSEREFEAKYEEILAAQRNGTFVYDLSGAAR